MPAATPTFWSEFNPRTGLFEVHDDRGPVLGFEHIDCRADADHHALDLIAAADAERAVLDDHEAQILAEAA
ncbi:hypothetical protein MEX01_48620 [Methylorubrum extorquens]|uniref:hypothetical protein n=1 Tax=Methylorubrum extorquens TaxID=408 RepID=UPI0011673F17|nr:hypothetical protein [Methylorubrum extorquens]GEL44271.1 hypothetical protein MEX01_48620 [Methylorubrum extorquens]